MEWYLIFVTGFFSFPTALTVIQEGPKSSVNPEGSNVTLQCLGKRRTNKIVWEDINENTVIFIDKEKYTRKEKFDNFVISNDEDNFSLTIINAQLSDEGFYSCEEGDERRRANVTIEAGPDLSILVNNTALLPKSRITVTEHQQVDVMCKADKARPAVHLNLKFGDSEWIKGNSTTKNEGLRFTTETRVVHRFTRTDTTVTCRASGQVSIPQSTTMIFTDVLPEGSTKYVAIIISGAFVCVIVIGVLLFIVNKRSKRLKCKFPDAGINLTSKEGDENDEGASTGGKVIEETPNSLFYNTEDHTSLNAASKDTLYDPGLQHLITPISTVLCHDWEIFAIEDLKLKPKTVKEIIRKHLDVADQLSVAMAHWVKSCPEASKSYLEKEILTKSSVYGYYMEHSQANPRGGENSKNKTEKAESDEQSSQEATFSDLLLEVAKCVGHFGGQRLQRQYPEVTVTGESFIKVLRERNLLTDDVKSLRLFKEALENSLLFRASHLVDTYINEKGLLGLALQKIGR